MRTVLLLAVLAALAAFAADPVAPPVTPPKPVTPELVSATFLGGAGADDLQGVAIGADGAIYVVGNVDQPIVPPEGVPTVLLGAPAEGTWYRCGFVAQMSPDGKALRRVVQFARGQVFLCSIAVGTNGVYLGGYADPKAGALFAGLQGLFATAEAANAAPIPWPLPGDPVRAGQPAENPADKHTLTILSRSHGDKDGVPCVLRMDTGMERLLGGTFLEGHHYAWNIGDDIMEDEWGPTPLAFLADGTVVVGHDGGVPGHYYYAPDYVSRLSPDLTKRLWRYDLFFPGTSIDKVRRHRSKDERAQWRVPFYGQTRILGLRTYKDGIYVGGWSVSATSSEPWWVPFLFKINPNGDMAWKAYSFDPMSGGGDRVSGEVADSLIRNVNFTADGDILIAGHADGGNSVLRKHPLNYDLNPQARFGGDQGKAPWRGGVRYKGLVIRLGETLEMKSGRWIGGAGKPAWIVDLAGLPGRRVVSLGRHTYGYIATPDAWSTDVAGPAGFLRISDEQFQDQFVTNIADFTPYALATQGTRVVAVGLARSGKPPVKDALQPTPGGGLDAYLLVVDCPEAKVE